MKSYYDVPLAKVVHHLRYSEYDKALEICNNLLEIEQNPKVYYVRAYFYTVIGNFEQALEDIDSVISFTAGHSSEWNLKGLILEKMGYRLEAKGCFLYNKGVDVDNLMADIHLM